MLLLDHVLDTVSDGEYDNEYQVSEKDWPIHRHVEHGQEGHRQRHARRPRASPPELELRKLAGERPEVSLCVLSGSTATK